MKSKNFDYSERIDHLRFIAALLIIVYHSFPAFFCVLNHQACSWSTCFAGTAQIHNLLFPLKALIFEGHTAVALFMTLSGFLFAQIASGREISYRQFFLNRVLRIYPLYFLAILLACYVVPQANSIVSVLTSLFCLQNLPQAVQQATLTPHLWTVAVEFQFYLIFPLLLIFYKRQGTRFLALLVLLAVTVRLFIYWQLGSVRNLAYETIFGRIDQFAIGMLVGFHYKRWQAQLRSPFYFLLAAVSLIATITLFNSKGGYEGTYNKSIWIIWTGIEAVVWSAVIATYCASSLSLPKFISRALAFLGGMSFSMYVNHFFITHTLAHSFGTMLQRASLHETPILSLFVSYLDNHKFDASLLFGLLVVFPAVSIFSLLTYFVIEKPFMELRGKYTKDRSKIDSVLQDGEVPDGKTKALVSVQR